jgi:PqqD family protein of HPr-rel-A system
MPGNLNDINENIRRLALSESGFVFDPVSGQSFTVNDTGLALLRLLQKSADEQQILDQLCQDFDAEPNDMARDLEEFVASLREQLGLQ